MNEEPRKKASHYAAITVSSDVLSGEHTNIGVIVWRPDWSLYGFRILQSLDRARRRGDLLDDDLTAEHVESWAARFVDRAALERWQESIGSAMSALSLSRTLPSLLPPDRLLAEMFAKLVRS